MKKSGVLMHISSLPGPYGCGSFGISAYKFVDLLAESGFSCWQTLPFGWPDHLGSPYKAISAFAGNPYFIDIAALHALGLLTEEELKSAEQNNEYVCEFSRLFEERIPLLKKASLRCNADLRTKVEAFIEKYPHIDEFCQFMACKEANGGKGWQDFDPEIKPKEEDLFLHRFIQYIFFDQWMQVKSYANSRNIEIIGDLPIYLDLDSSDVWVNPKNFKVDKDGRPTEVAGVPPDYFSPDGQLWGNPLYDWAAMKKEKYQWWKERIEWQLTLYDGIRIDHFRAFSAYWSVPADAKTAKAGKWIKGPGLKFVEELKKVANGKLIIAEDLGDIDQDVVDLLKDSGLPGMRVFQFAFLADNSPHQPQNYVENCVAYTGTHDNNTLVGFIWESNENDRRKMMDYIGWPEWEWQRSYPMIIKTMMRSSANRVIFPIQDILGYGADTRMNIPGVPDHNWAFRLTQQQLDLVDRGYYQYQNYLFGRYEYPKKAEEKAEDQEAADNENAGL